MTRKEQEIMEMKNKLFRHHKSKFALMLRNFSLTFMGLFLVVAAFTVPTYLSVVGSAEYQMQASEANDEENLDNEDSESELQEELLSLN